jgi:hypothetical protein
MYNGLVEQLDGISQTTTIKKRHTKSIKKDLDSAVDSLLDNKESIVVIPSNNKKPKKENSIPDISNLKKIKTNIVINKPIQKTPTKKKTSEVVWL